MKKITTLTLLLIFVFFTSSLFATNYYVSALTGNDAYPGTLAQPFATIKKGANLPTPVILFL